MAYVIIDTSSILFGFANRKDVFEIAKTKLHSNEQMISVGILNELSKASTNRGAKGASARLAIESLSYKKIAVDNSAGSVDSWILAKSQKYPHTIVVTNDTALYKKLKRSNIKSLKLTKAGLLK